MSKQHPELRQCLIGQDNIWDVSKSLDKNSGHHQILLLVMILAFAFSHRFFALYF